MKAPSGSIVVYKTANFGSFDGEKVKIEDSSENLHAFQAKGCAASD